MRQHLSSFLSLVLVCSLIGLAGQWFYFADLFSHFRPLALLAGVGLLPLALLLRHVQAIRLACIIILLNVVMIGVPYWRMWPPHAPAAAPAIRVMSANVLAANRNMDGLKDSIAAHDPDIVLIIEATPERLASLASLKARYPYMADLTDDQSNFGLAALSKQPFTAVPVPNHGYYHAPMLRLDFAGYSVIAAHPPPPMNRQAAKDHLAIIHQLAAIARDTDQPLIIAGDFNTALWSRTMQPFWQLDIATANRSVLTTTWPRLIPYIGIQIDHVLVKGFAVSAFQTVENPGSDHKGILATLALR